MGPNAYRASDARISVWLDLCLLVLPRGGIKYLDSHLRRALKKRECWKIRSVLVASETDCDSLGIFRKAVPALSG